MATEAEYGDHLKRLIEPLICGVGPVEAGIVTAQTLANERQIDLVVSLGSAGSKRLTQGEVYQASIIAYRDMDASAFGFPKGETPFLGEPAAQELPHQIAGLLSASLSTGGNVVSCDGYDAIAEDMVDMETYAIWRACRRAGVAMIGLRGISDGAKPVAGYEDWTALLAHIDEGLAWALEEMVRQIEAGQLKIG